MSSVNATKTTNNISNVFGIHSHRAVFVFTANVLMYSYSWTSIDEI